MFRYGGYSKKRTLRGDKLWQTIEAEELTKSSREKSVV